MIVRPSRRRKPAVPTLVRIIDLHLDLMPNSSGDVRALVQVIDTPLLTAWTKDLCFLPDLHTTYLWNTDGTLTPVESDHAPVLQ